MILEKQTIESPVKPVSAEIFYEDGVPYMKYKGTTYMNNGLKVMIDIPKMSLTLSEIVCATETEYHTSAVDRVMTSYKREFFANTEGIAFTITPISRKCRKADLEKELGYRLDLTD